jgi:integrase
MVRRGLVNENIWQGQQMSTKGSAKKRQAWTMREASSLIETAPTRLLKHAIAIAALSGMRASEITSLRAGDCRNGIFKVKVHEPGKTDAATRHVPIHSYLGAIIESRLHGKHDADYLLHEVKGSSKGLVKRFARYRQQLYGKQMGQADKTFHSLRHGFVTEALRADCDLYLVQYCVGHQPAGGVTLGVYHKGPSPEQLRKVVESVMLD